MHGSCIHSGTQPGIICGCSGIGAGRVAAPLQQAINEVNRIMITR